ncbi:hypothetical protein Bsel_1925 [[Bacillus] selenitireducens MLS10]|uniref:Uncharacterized protein n=2 Tax=Salisediminibacterium selenitireducens TaxID=85683 RepID=D6XUE3_BACIE|nr:hypothetical protein Bsel_1925 [[Bacillus] selenitireducens MLS10]
MSSMTSDQMIYYLIPAAIICIIALILTIKIGIDPDDKDYDRKTKSHFTNMSVIYAVTFIPALILTVVYFIYG